MQRLTCEQLSQKGTTTSPVVRLSQKPGSWNNSHCPPGKLDVYFTLGKSLIQWLAHKPARSLGAGSCTATTMSWSYHPHSPWSLLGCFGSTATRTIGVASKLRGVNGGQAGDVDSVADFSTKSCRPPIPNGNWGGGEGRTTKKDHKLSY